MSMRNYKKEYENYHSRPEQKLRRAARNRARADMKKTTAPEKIEGKDVHHKDNNPLNNDKSNLSIVSQRYNRREPRLRTEAMSKAEIQKTLKKIKGLTTKQIQFLMTIPQPTMMAIVNTLSTLTMSEVKEFMNSEEMGTITGPHISGTGDDSSTVVVRKKKNAKVQRRQQMLLKDRIKKMARGKK